MVRNSTGGTGGFIFDPDHRYRQHSVTQFVERLIPSVPDLGKPFCLAGLNGIEDRSFSQPLRKFFIESWESRVEQRVICYSDLSPRPPSNNLGPFGILLMPSFLLHHSANARIGMFWKSHWIDRERRLTCSTLVLTMGSRRLE